jgi:starch synthase
MKGKLMKIVHATAELFPYAKTGGLADMVGSLAATLADNGHDISVFLPGYREVLENLDTMSPMHLLRLEMDESEVWTFSPRKNLRVFLICSQEFFDRSGIYGNDGHDFDDNHKRFVFFTKAVVKTMRLLKLYADVVHCHDWQTALLPMLLQHAELHHGVRLAKRTIFTIHNIAFQGSFPVQSIDRMDLPDNALSRGDLEYNGQINMLKGGILFADQVTTVSPRYAREIRTTEFGCGLDRVVAMRGDKLVGILNGIDPAVWSPITDGHLPACYSVADISGKYACRNELLKRLALEPEFKGPVFGMVCRLTEQKGINLVLANKDFFLGESRLIVLGSGERPYEEALVNLAETASGKIGFCKCFDEAMSHLIEAGSDFFLMPSLYEPCGLNQMYSQVYGTVPLVSRVGGLLDTVTDVDEQPEKGTGITFPPTAAGFRDGLVRALGLFAEKPRLAGVQQRGMQKDFSWAKAAMTYERFYTDTLGSASPNENNGLLSTASYAAMAMAG